MEASEKFRRVADYKNMPHLLELLRDHATLDRKENIE
jgi:hypothetical protein